MFDNCISIIYLRDYTGDSSYSWRVCIDGIFPPDSSHEPIFFHTWHLKSNVFKANALSGLAVLQADQLRHSRFRIVKIFLLNVSFNI